MRLCPLTPSSFLLLLLLPWHCIHAYTDKKWLSCIPEVTMWHGPLNPFHSPCTCASPKHVPTFHMPCGMSDSASVKHQFYIMVFPIDTLPWQSHTRAHCQVSLFKPPQLLCPFLTFHLKSLSKAIVLALVTSRFSPLTLCGLLLSKTNLLMVYLTTRLSSSVAHFQTSTQTPCIWTHRWTKGAIVYVLNNIQY